MAHVDFYFSPGSRYSYLAATQIGAIAGEATVSWRAVYGPDLIRGAGGDPFADGQLRGQYRGEYRTRDVARWAHLLGVPFRDPVLEGTDWPKLALACAAAEHAGSGAAFGLAMLSAVSGRGAPPQGDADLAALAAGCGADYRAISSAMADRSASAVLERNLANALAAGAFGVPTFIVDDGEVFWGQDRIPLLLHHLRTRG